MSNMAYRYWHGVCLREAADSVRCNNWIGAFDCVGVHVHFGAVFKWSQCSMFVLPCCGWSDENGARSGGMAHERVAMQSVLGWSVSWIEAATTLCGQVHALLVVGHEKV